MNEMDLLTQLRDEIPAGPPSSRAEAALLSAISHEPTESKRATRHGLTRRARTSGAPPHGAQARRARTSRALAWRPDRRMLTHGTAAWAPGRLPGGRAWRPALAGGTAVALAALIAVAVAGQSGGSPPAPGYTVAELASHASAAAEAQPDVRPGQWVYRKVLQSGLPNGPYRIWTTADDSTAAYRFGGKVTLMHGPFAGLPEAYRSKFGGIATGDVTGPPSIRYDQLGSLPGSPGALRDYLLNFPLQGFADREQKAFYLIEFLLTSYVMPPGLTSELYQALGGIPTVMVDNHATDAAGRPGVGFIFMEPVRPGAKPAVAGEEIVISARTFHFMGAQNILKHPGEPAHGTGGTAILRQVLVSGPGVLP